MIDITRQSLIQPRMDARRQTGLIRPPDVRRQLHPPEVRSWAARAFCGSDAVGA